jgi:hypothetical protein
MPLIYRSMLADGDKPMVGSTARTLGVRVAPDPKPDISVDPNGLVQPRTGGMSVAPEWRLLPGHRVPKRLRPKFPRATGSDNLFCWRMGEGSFTADQLTADLHFRPDPTAADRHGIVEPLQPMTVTQYQAALAATAPLWTIDEA